MCHAPCAVVSGKTVSTSEEDGAPRHGPSARRFLYEVGGVVEYTNSEVRAVIHDAGVCIECLKSVGAPGTGGRYDVLVHVTGIPGEKNDGRIGPLVVNEH